MNTPSLKGKHVIPKWITFTLTTAVALLTISLFVFNFGQSIGGHQVEFSELTEEVTDFKAAFEKHCEDNKVLFDGIKSAADAQREYQHKMELFITKLDGKLNALQVKQ